MNKLLVLFTCVFSFYSGLISSLVYLDLNKDENKVNYNKEVIEETVETFTTRGTSTLYLDVTHSIDYLKNRRVLIFDDVLSTGSSLKAIENIMQKVGANVVGKCFIFSEGMDERPKDVYYVHKLPIIEVD